jgi:hypothetical protein
MAAVQTTAATRQTLTVSRAKLCHEDAFLAADGSEWSALAPGIL